MTDPERVRLISKSGERVVIGAEGTRLRPAEIASGCRSVETDPEKPAETSTTGQV
jgi:hypothetical protein